MAPGAHGLSGAKAPGRELAARTLDLGLSGEFLPGLSWQTEAFLAKERRGDARGERGIGAKLRWTSPRREAAGTLEWFRQLGGTRLVAKEMEELLTLQPSLQLTKSRAQRVWRLSGEYRPGEGERTVIPEPLAPGNSSARMPAQSHFIGVSLAHPWSEKLDVILGMGARQAQRDSPGYRWLGAGGIYHQ